MTFRDHNTVEFEDDAGNKKELKCDERYYVPSEITWLLKTLGYTKIDIFGAKLGAYSRNDKLTTEDFEMLVVAEKYCHVAAVDISQHRDGIMPLSRSPYRRKDQS